MSTSVSKAPASAARRRRFLIAIFFAAAALLVLSMWATFRAGRVSLQSQARMNGQLGIIDQIRLLDSTVKDAETGQRGYLLTGDESYLQPYHDALPRLKTELATLEKTAADGLIPKDMVARINNVVQQKLGELAKTIQLRRDKGASAALSEVRTGRGKDFMEDLRQQCDLLLESARADYDAAAQRAAEADTLRNVVFIIVTVVYLAFLAWACFQILQQEWLQSGHLLLAERMSGDQPLDDLGDKALRFLAEYLNAQVGAIFLEDGGKFRRFATYAVPVSQELPQGFLPGEGLIGQAAKDKRALLVRNVPPGYLTVASGLGQARPRRLLVAPMCVDNEVYAVVELGFFHGSFRPELQFLERVNETVGAAVRSARYRQRLQQLLEQTQRQAEELQTQSEELRVTNEELEEQGRALKDSEGRLEEQQLELKHSNSQLEEQTQILKSQRDDLTRAKDDLERQATVVERASRYKSDFVASMSHELRTPLNSSLILAKLLADNREGNLTEEQVRYAQTIQSAGNDLLNLINDVLDLSKVEAGKMDLKPERFQVKEVLDSMRGMFEPLAHNKGLAFHTTLAPDVPEFLETDRRRLEQVLKNLLSNAIKFTSGGEIALEVSRVPGRRVAFAVRDTGVGIPQEQQERIFEPFYQGENPDTRKYGGTGLGLSISRELVRLLGGRIEVMSKPGEGSTFTLTLPEIYKSERVREAGFILKTAAQPDLPATPVEKRAAAAPHVADDRNRLEPGSRIILVVEDDDSFAGILADLCREVKFKALVAHTAEDALLLAAQYRPDAIILDIGLPDNSGMFVLERLKADPRTRHIPVHIVSAGENSQPALAMGAIGYMLKPVRREQLLEALEDLNHRLTGRVRRVLLVEDDPGQRESLTQLLASPGVEVVGVRTAAECQEKLKSTAFDCMILDLTLPDKSGFQLLEQLGEEGAIPPVIVYTGRDLNAAEEQQLRRHSRSIIIKGAKSPERLLDEVTLFLHQVVSDLPADQQQMLQSARSRDAALKGKHILIAEDDVRNIFALTALLEPKGIKVQIARNGREAVQAVEQAAAGANGRIDLVLMDIMMPEMDGLEAMRQIRKNPANQRLPIIALTAKAMKDDQEQCLRAGASDYLAKPLDVEKLLSLVRIWIPR